MKRKSYVFNSLCEIPKVNSEKYADKMSHKFRVGNKKVIKTYKEYYNDIQAIAAGLNGFGTDTGSTVSLFCDNRYEWTVLDYALQGLNIISVPRGTDSSAVELIFIYKHSDSNFLIVENWKLLEKILEHLTKDIYDNMEKIFIIDREEHATYTNNKFPDLMDRIAYYDDILELGKKVLKKNANFYENKLAKIGPKNVVSIVYTSGTTGNPKGVILTQKNFLHNVRVITPLAKVKNPGIETALSVLPIWHVYERTFENCCYAAGVATIYSDIKNFGKDLQEESPTLVASVPRIWQSIYEKIINSVKKKPPFARYLFFMFLKTNLYWKLSLNYMKGLYISFKKRNIFLKSIVFIYHFLRFMLLLPLHLLALSIFTPIKNKLGKNLRASFSGAGALPRYVDNFFNSIGIVLINAYGMTEASPGIMSRALDRNTIGVTGRPFDETELRVLNKDGVEAKIGEKGVLYARGEQVMTGYYKNIEKTEEVLDKNGWLNTGDYAVKTENGDLIIVGRAKDTIVLLGGENVEPEAIEEAINDCIYIDHAVVLGQDKKALEALITLNTDNINKLANELKLKVEDIIKEGEEVITNSAVIKFLKNKINEVITPKRGFKRYEKITKITVLNKKFKKGEELTHTLKIKRSYIEKKYRELIKKVNKVFGKKS